MSGARLDSSPRLLLKQKGLKVCEEIEKEEQERKGDIYISILVL